MLPNKRRMRVSGIEWLGQIPEEWEVRRLKHVVEFCGGGTPAKENADFWGGDIPWVSPKDMKSGVIFDSEDHITAEGLRNSATRLVPLGSVLLVVRSGILRHTIPVALNAAPVALNQDMKALLPKDDVEPAYLRYLIEGNQHLLLLEWRKAGATVESIEHELLANTYVPVPPKDEQRAISMFLDRKTAALDQLIRKKERLIDLLREKRQAVISRAVTRGLSLSAPTKPSTLEWLSDIPTHWELVRLKYLLISIEQGWSPSCENRIAEEEEWGVLKAGCVNGVEFDPAENKALPLDLDPIPKLEVQPGDILMSRANTRALLGSVARVRECRRRLLLCDKLYRLTHRPDLVDGNYLTMVLRASISRYQMERDATGTSSSMQNIGQDTVHELLLPVPPLQEQVQIVETIGRVTGAIDVLEARTSQSIARLRTYRQTLISAAVTGKIDVRQETLACP